MSKAPNTILISYKWSWRPLPAAAASGFAYAEMLAGQWGDENYSHGLLGPLIIGYIPAGLAHAAHRCASAL